MKPINIQLGINIERYRKLRTKFTQEDVADLLGMSRTNHCNLVNGLFNWLPTHIWNLCRIFNCKPTHLFPKVSPVKIKYKIANKRMVSKNKKCYLKIETK